MGAVTTLPAPPCTRADLAAMPDDGRRYELIDGTLVVTPSPSYWVVDPVDPALVAWTWSRAPASRSPGCPARSSGPRRSRSAWRSAPRTWWP